MPEAKTLQRARADRNAGKSSSTQAGEFVREEMDHIREGKHGARSTKQAIAIGLSKARRAGVELAAPQWAKTSEQTRKRAARDYARGHGAPVKRPPSAKRSRASENALQRETTDAASPQALSRHAHAVAKAEGPRRRSAIAQKAARTRQARVARG